MAKDDTAAIIEAHKKAEARKAEIRAKREKEREARAGESKADAFKRIALRRVNSALDEIAKLRGLSNKANYDYTEEQYNTILTALRNEIAKVEADFQRGGPARSDSGFTL